MTPDAGLLEERLRELRSRGRSELVPLWIEALSPEEALRELAGRTDALSSVQRARFLRLLSRHAEAAATLAGLERLPAGLALARDALLASEPAADFGEEDAASGLACAAEPTEAVGPAAALEAWLASVRQWRRALRV